MYIIANILTIQSWSSVSLVWEPFSEKSVSLSGHSLRDHPSCSPFHTVIQSVCGLRFPPPPHCSLFFLQPLFFWVGLVPSPVLHQPLVWSQTAVSQSYTFLLLIQGQCQRREVVHVLSILSEEEIDESKTLWCSAITILTKLNNYSDSCIVMFSLMRLMRQALTGAGISSTAVWGTTSDRQSSACPLIHSHLGCSE